MEAIPSIEERLTSLERSMGEMTRMMREIVGRSPSISCSSASQLTHGINTPDASHDDTPFTHCTPKPGHLFQELQSEIFGGSEAANPQLLGDMTTKGIIDSGLSLQLMRLYVGLRLTAPMAIVITDTYWLQIRRPLWLLGLDRRPLRYP